MSVQHDLFDGKTGTQLGHEAAQRAADHAGDEWKELAYESLCDYAKHHVSFTVEQVRSARPDLPPPPELRAWGAVALRARRAGIVKGIGWTPAEDRAVHGGVITLWRSLIYSGGPTGHDPDADT